MRKLRFCAVFAVFSQEHAGPVYGARRETGDPTQRLDQHMVVLSHLGFFFQFHFVHVPATGMGVYTDGVFDRTLQFVSRGVFNIVSWLERRVVAATTQVRLLEWSIRLTAPLTFLTGVCFRGSLRERCYRADQGLHRVSDNLATDILVWLRTARYDCSV